MNKRFPLLFALGTAICWGCYGPVLGSARVGLAPASPFKAYLGIGIAYLIWGIAGSCIGMKARKDSFHFLGDSFRGMVWAIAAGTLGAWGALNLTLSMFSGGNKIQHVVMPIVFGGAVTISALVSLIQHRKSSHATPWLWAGIVGMGVCAVIVASLSHKPAGETGETSALVPILFALGTALCWGCYGPVLGNARVVDPHPSPFKPYLGIGIAYLVWAIAGGLIGMVVQGDPFSLSGTAGTGMVLAIAAGSLGAFGALFLTLAMSTGGARIPHVVMPVVFGGAVTVIALVSIITHGAGNASVGLWLGIVGMGACAVIVAYNTPHPHPPKKLQTVPETQQAIEGA